MEKDDLRKYLSETDLKVFKWAVCRYMCESHQTYFTKGQLFLYLKENLRAYNFAENPDNVYTNVLDEVMKDLADRRFVMKKNGQMPFEDIVYEKTELLHNKCPIVLKYYLGNIDKDLA